MENNNTTQIDDSSPEVIKRRSLLPWWIKIFSWVFIVGGLLSVMSWIIALIIGDPPYVNLFTPGMNTTELFSPWGMFLGVLVLYKMYVGYALWFEKDYAITLGKVDALVSIFACVFAMLIALISYNVLHLRIEIIVLIPYYITLSAIEYEWKYRERQI